MGNRKLLKFLAWWPPLLGAGIKVKSISDNFRTVEVELHQYFWNRNYVGTHFGGSLYAMCDPFYMLILIENLGPDFIVWDKAAKIRFKKPGRGVVKAKFQISEEEIERIRNQAMTQEKVEPLFTVQVVDSMGEVVAEVEKLLYIKRKGI